MPKSLAAERRWSLFATAESSPLGLESAHRNWLAEEADDVRSVFRILGLLVGPMLIRERGGSPLQCAGHMRRGARFAGMHTDLEVDGDLDLPPGSCIDLDDYSS